MIESDLASSNYIYIYGSNCRTSDLGHWNNITTANEEMFNGMFTYFTVHLCVDCTYLCDNSLAESVQSWGFNTQYAWLSGYPEGLWEIVPNCRSSAESRFNNTRICIAG